MEIITIECPKCKGELHVKAGTEKLFCMYCRSEVRVQQENIRVVNSASLLTRGFLLLEYSDWQKAEEVFEQVANIEPENGKVYLGKLLAELKLDKEENLSYHYSLLSEYINYQKALRFADTSLKKKLENHNEVIRQRILNSRKSELERFSTEQKRIIDAEQGSKNVDCRLSLKIF